jgi:hypothetical protein
MTAALLTLAGGAVADEVTFSFVPPDGWQVEGISIRGSFNDWGETPMEQGDDGTWSAVVELEPGEYEYKFFINGEWPEDMETWLDGFPVDTAGRTRFVSSGGRVAGRTWPLRRRSHRRRGFRTALHACTTTARGADTAGGGCTSGATPTSPSSGHRHFRRPGATSTVSIGT